MSKEYKEAKFSDVTLKITDRDHFTPTYVETGGVPIISPKDFNHFDKISFNDCKYITKEAHLHNRKKTNLETDDIVFTRIGARLGKACIVESWMPEFSILHSAAMIRVDIKKINPLYFLYYLKSFLLQKQIKVEVQSIGVPDLGLDKINDFKIKYPPLPTQIKIAKILTTIDNVIEKTQATITKYEAIKQGMIQDLFTRGIDKNRRLRPKYKDAPELYKDSFLGWIPRGWKMERLDKLTSLITDGSHFSPKPLEEGHLIGNVKDMKQFDFNYDSCTRISSDEFKYLTKQNCKPKKNDVLLSKDGTIGRVILFNGKRDLVLLSSIAIIRPIPEKVNAGYLSHILKSFHFHKQLFALQSGSALKRIVLLDIKKLKIPFPQSLEEQKIIYHKMKTFDDKIEQELIILSKQQALKQGLMQDLLTGKKEVKT